jgi:hypothetical protein
MSPRSHGKHGATKSNLKFHSLIVSAILFSVNNVYCVTPYEQAMQLLARMKSANSAIVDLRCRFTMDITKNNKRLPEQRMIFRYRAKPETIHLTFMKPHKGRKVLYVRGDKKMKVRPNGFWRFTTVEVDPNSERGMEEGIDPITAQGFPEIVSAAEQLLKDSIRNPEYSVAVEPELEHSSKFIQLEIHTGESGDYKLLIESSTYFPVKIFKQNRKGRAVYSYDDIEVNPNMSDSEFKL